MISRTDMCQGDWSCSTDFAGQGIDSHAWNLDSSKFSGRLPRGHDEVVIIGPICPLPPSTLVVGGRAYSVFFPRCLQQYLVAGYQ